MGRIVCYLFCLSFICTAVFGVTYARYTKSVNGSASADIAAVAMNGVITSGQNIDVGGMQPGDSRNVRFQVINFSDGIVSETAQIYTVTVKTSGNLPFIFSLNAEGGTAAFAGNLKTDANGVWKTATPGELPAAAETSHTYILTVSWPKEQKAPEYADEIDVVTLIIDAEQALPSASGQ